MSYVAQFSNIKFFYSKDLIYFNTITTVNLTNTNKYNLSGNTHFRGNLAENKWEWGNWRIKIHNFIKKKETVEKTTAHWELYKANSHIYLRKEQCKIRRAAVKH